MASIPLTTSIDVETSVSAQPIVQAYLNGEFA